MVNLSRGKGSLAGAGWGEQQRVLDVPLLGQTKVFVHVESVVPVFVIALVSPHNRSTSQCQQPLLCSIQGKSQLKFPQISANYCVTNFIH